MDRTASETHAELCRLAEADRLATKREELRLIKRKLDSVIARASSNILRERRFPLIMRCE